MKSLEDNPHKGKTLTNISGILIKEIKYEKFRFYFITDGQIIKFGTEDELANLLIRFVKMSEKKDQKRIINELKLVLQSLGLEKF